MKKSSESRSWCSRSDEFHDILSRKVAVPYSRKSLERDLERLRQAWQDSQQTRIRESVYRYLTAVFELSQVWEAEDSLVKRAEGALQLMFPRTTLTGDPHSLLILCTADRTHRRTVSKWSRVLRFASQAKKTEETFKEFVRRHGGINQAASTFTARLRRRKGQKLS